MIYNNFKFKTTRVIENYLFKVPTKINLPSDSSLSDNIYLTPCNRKMYTYLHKIKNKKHIIVKSRFLLLCTKIYNQDKT